MPVLMPEFGFQVKNQAAWDARFSGWAAYLQTPKPEQRPVPGGGKVPVIKISLKGGVATEQFAMITGMLCYLRPGDILRDGAFSFTANVPTVVIKTLPGNEPAKLAKVIPIPCYVIYENVNQKQLKQDLVAAGGPIDRVLNIQALVMEIMQRRSLQVGFGFEAGDKQKLATRLRKTLTDRLLKSLLPAPGENRNGLVTIQVLAGEWIGEFNSELTLSLVKLTKRRGAPATVSYIDPTQCFKALAQLESRLQQHPLALWAIKQQQSLSFVLRFEYWRVADKKYKPIDWGPNASVKINNDIPLLPTVGSLNPRGEITLVIPKNKYQTLIGSKLYFVVDLNEHFIGTTKLPQQWRSTGKYDVNGMPGFFEKFQGVSLGNAAEPLVFRLGVHIHVQLLYQDGYRREYDKHIAENASARVIRFHGISLKRKNQYGRLRRFPPGVKVGISGKTNSVTSYCRTDANGVIDTWLPDMTVQPMAIKVFTDIEIPSIGLKRTVVANSYLDFISIRSATAMSWETEARLARGMNETLGKTGNGPQVIRLPDTDRHIVFRNAVFTLKKVLEMHRWLNYMTKDGPGSTPLWQAKPLTIGLHDKPKSWFRGITSNARIFGKQLAINIYVDPQRKLVSLSTIAHEYGHFVQSVAWESTETVWNRVATSLGFDPHSKKVINEFTALIEGWAPFFSLVFDHKSYESPPRKFSLPRNSGEKIEDAVAHAIFDLYQYEMLPAALKDKTVGDSENGDISAIPHGYCNGTAYYPKFNQYLWVPFTQLSTYFQSWGTAPPPLGIRQFCQNILTIPANRTLWKTNLRRHFHRRNIVRDL